MIFPFNICNDLYAASDNMYAEWIKESFINFEPKLKNELYEIKNSNNLLRDLELRTFELRIESEIDG